MLLNALFLFGLTVGVKSDSDIPLLFGEHPYIFEKFKEVLVDVRNYYRTPLEAEVEFKAIMKEMRKKYPANLSEDEFPTMIFPLVGSKLSAVGGKNGSGFYVRNFDLFDQNVSGSHPAHDIFIYDRNRDCIDDIREEYVDVVSVGNGIVMAVESKWTEDMPYKGGNYVWVYDLDRGGLWYYAHNRISVVEAGQRLRPGDKIGEVGRTGFNALQGRSDTHLHLMYLELDEDCYPHPVNYFQWLKEAEVVYISETAQKLETRSTIHKLFSRRQKAVNPEKFKLRIK